MKSYSTASGIETLRVPCEFSPTECQNVCDFLSSGEPVPELLLPALERIQKSWRIETGPEEAVWWDEAYNGVGE